MNNLPPLSRFGQLQLNFSIPVSFEISPEFYSTYALYKDLDYSRFYKKINKMGRPLKVKPEEMVILIVYAGVKGYFSLRSFENLNTDMCAIWLIKNNKIPSYSTFCRFINSYKKEIEDIYYQSIKRLDKLRELNKETIYQDGTKVEARANKYTFVWRKALEKNFDKLLNRVSKYSEDYTTLLRINKKILYYIN